MNSTISIWQGHCAATETDDLSYWQILSQVEQNHALTIKHEQNRRRYVEIRARVRWLLGDAVGAQPEQLRLDKSEHGKPFLVDYPDLCFNLSHCADKVIIAIAYHCDLGVDIEYCKSRRNLSGLVDKCFADEEKHYWQQLPEAEQEFAFYRFWTRKEAFVKATGTGIALGLNRCIFNPRKPSELLYIPEEYGQPSEWWVQDIDLEGKLFGALAVRSKVSEKRSWRISIDSPPV